MQKIKMIKVRIKIKEGKKNFMMKKLGLCMDKSRSRDAPLSLSTCNYFWFSTLHAIIQVCQM